MEYKDPLDTLRDLAKEDYYQSLYSSAKDLGLQLFENRTDLTRIQLWFISFMSIYSVINMDIALGEVSERVLENTIYEDAYLMYKKKTGAKKVNKSKEPVITPARGKEEVSKSQWLFKRGKGKTTP